MAEQDLESLINEALQNSPTKGTSSPLLSKDTQTSSSKQESRSASHYIPLEFKDAAEFICFFDPALRTGKKKLYKWQIEELQFLSQRHRFTTAEPLEHILLAANGSGKDAYIIAGFVVFVLCCWKRYKIILTSASDQQLDSQTRNYIKYLSQQVNDYLRRSGILPCAIDIKKETFTSKIYKNKDGTQLALTGSEVYTFVTNEGGRAEGHHPFPDADPGEGVIIIVNEAKTVPQEIYDHFAKCTYNYFIQVSSAGRNSGNLYHSWIKGVEYPAEYEKGKYYCRRITAFDCPHISLAKLQREEEEFGPDDPWYKNTRLSLFSSLGEAVVLSEEILDKCLAVSCRLQLGLGRRAGLDLSGRGNDFNTFYVVDENELIAYHRWRAKDTEQTVDTLIGTEDGKSVGLFQRYGFTPETCGNRISGDDNGIGQGIIDGLAKRGWNIRRVLNQSSAINGQRYLNRGAEMWFSFQRIVIAGLFYASKEMFHPELKRQLSNRHYSQEGVGKYKLWSKSEERAGAKGKKKTAYAQDSSDSPDDADALILAFSSLSFYDFDANQVNLQKASIPIIPTTKDILQNNSVRNKYFSQQEVAKKGSTLVDLMRSLY